MSFDELDALAAEIRAFLIANVSRTGGHLASNLGVVELTIAIHNVFDSEKDRILFDVGHQSYVHKILTGRADQFDSLRAYGGMAGFPKPSESVSDAFTAGHASSAVSTALGIARARTLRNEDYSVVAVVGDGAMTGGLFYEGMNDAGSSMEPMIVILNDNGMSISENVGSISGYLSRLRLKPAYFGLKRRYRMLMKKLPGGSVIYQKTHAFKDKLRKRLLGTTIFEQMGFKYLGPIDGHDIRKISYLLSRAKEEACPVLLHVITKKGKGYTPAEQTPAEYHGVGSFDPRCGVTPSGSESFSAALGDALAEIAEQNRSVCAITAGMADGTGLTRFAERFPERFFDVGIAEGHAVSMAAGLAKQGFCPVFAVYSTFLQRGYDMILQDIALQNLHAVFCVDRAGLVGADGETHHGVFDVGYLRDVPGMTVLAPASYAELREMLDTAVNRMDSPVAIRYPRGNQGDSAFPMDRDLVRTGSDLTILTYGTLTENAITAAKTLKQQGISAEILRLRRLKPLDLRETERSVRKTGRLLIVEEQNSHSGIGESVCARLMEDGIFCLLRRLDLGDEYITHGDTELLRQIAGIDAEAIVRTALEELHLES